MTKLHSTHNIGDFRFLLRAYGLVDSCYSEFCEFFVHWNEQTLAKYGQTVATKKMYGSFSEIAASIKELVAPSPSTFLIVELAENRLAYFDNSLQGLSSSGALNVFSRKTGNTVYQIANVNSETMLPNELHGTLLSKIEHGDSVRTIHAIDEGNKWTFHQQGEPLRWETVEDYQKRSIRSRFTSDHIDRLLIDLDLPTAKEVSERSTKLRALCIMKAGKIPAVTKSIPLNVNN